MKFCVSWYEMTPVVGGFVVRSPDPVRMEREFDHLDDAMRCWASRLRAERPRLFYRAPA